MASDYETMDAVISFQECQTGFPVSGRLDDRTGYTLTIDDAAEAWARSPSTPEAKEAMKTARQEVSRLNKMLRGVRDYRQAVRIINAEGHEAEVL